MYSVSAEFLQAIRGPHTAAFKVDVWQSGANVTPSRYADSGLPITGGSVTVDASSQVRRTVSLTVADPGLTPVTAQDLLAPYGTELRVQRGIRYPNGVIEWVVLGWFRIDNDSLTISGQSGPTEISLTGSGREAFIVDARFWKVMQADKGVTVPHLIAGLAVNALPSHVPATVDLTGSTVIPATAFVWDDKDRMGACSSMATGIGAEFFINADGTPTIRKVATPDKTKVVWTVDAGPKGSMVEVTPAVDRANVYNSVVAICQTADGTDGIQATALDSDPTSATFYGGRFGKKPRFYSSATLAGSSPAATLTKCQVAAANLLARYKGAGWTIAVSTLVNPALDAGDVIQVNLPDGRIQYHVIDQVVVPLDVSTVQTIQTRSNDPEGDIT